MVNKRNSMEETTRRRLQEQGIYLVNRMRSQSRSNEEILDALVRSGLSRPDALTLLSGGQITSVPGSTDEKKLAGIQPRKGMSDQTILGIFLLLVGVAVTGITIASASQKGGYIIAPTGLIAWGIALIIKGSMKK